MKRIALIWDGRDIRCMVGWHAFRRMMGGYLVCDRRRCAGQIFTLRGESVPCPWFDIKLGQCVKHHGHSGDHSFIPEAA